MVVSETRSVVKFGSIASKGECNVLLSQTMSLPFQVHYATLYSSFLYQILPVIKKVIYELADGSDPFIFIRRLIDPFIYLKMNF